MAFSVRNIFSAGKHRPWTIGGCVLLLVGIVMVVFGLLPRQAAEKPVIAPSTTAVQPSPTAAGEFADPKGAPVSMIITQPGIEDIAMNFAPRIKSGNRFDSESGKVAWWDEMNWPTPGSLSPAKSLITGHMRYGTTHYPIARLSQVKAGAVLTVNYDSGDVVIAKATADAVLVDKDQTNQKKENLYNPSLARIIRVTTCDPTNGVDKDGHTLQNSIVFFERTK